MKTRIVVLGAGFGGLELCSTLAEKLGDAVDVTLIDRADGFVFGFAKLEVLFGRKTPEAVRTPYRELVKPGVTFKQETVTAIDPAARKVTTSGGTYEADHLVIALGAGYDATATPGLVLGQNEFYSVDGAATLAKMLAAFTEGHAVIGVCGAPYKCPPAPSECALLLHEYLSARGIRTACSITLVTPLPSPVPPSPDASARLVATFGERGINLISGKSIAAIDRSGKLVYLADGSELPCDVFLGVPKHRAPDVVVASGLTKDGWVEVDPYTLETAAPGVYAIGDLANTGGPKAGVFAEGAGHTVALNIISRVRGQEPTAKNPLSGACYIEFGGDEVARVDVKFVPGGKPEGVLRGPNRELRADKQQFGTVRKARWFGSS